MKFFYHPSKFKIVRFAAIVILMATCLLVFNSLLDVQVGRKKAIASASFVQPTSRTIWSEYSQNPDAHPHIPNNSYAGYHQGNTIIPSPPVVTSIQSFGGRGDGVIDNTQAFKLAIADTANKGGGAIFIPPGNYLVKGFIHLNQSGIVLRGAGTAKTKITFLHPLKDVIYPLTYYKNQSKWSWLGGLVWISPSDTFNSQGKIVTATGEIASGKTSTDDWERWRYPQSDLAKVISNSQRGDITLKVDSTTYLQPGTFVLLTWQETKDYSLAKHIAGSGLMNNYPWNNAKLQTEYHWPVKIENIIDNTVYLSQPLRLNVLPKWEVKFKNIGAYIQESGIENLAIEMVNVPLAVPHLENVGYNGIYFNRAINCWARNVKIINSENGLIISQSKNITSQNTIFNGDVKMHHATANRFSAADILIRDFTIESPVIHGINVENFSSGNVWSRGQMLHGTFDSHRGLPFDLIRTEITMLNDGSPGGANHAGPFNGKNVVHWNINITGSRAKFVYQPDAHSYGALVGIRGVEQDSSCAWAMVCGDKKVIVAEAGLTPTPANLYVAQINLRHYHNSWKTQAP